MKIISNNNINLYDNDFIKLLLELINSVVNNNINIPKYNITNIKKINKQYPLLYYFFKEYIKDINNIDDFIKYYSYNQHNLDIDKIYKDIKNNKILLKLFNTIYNRDDRSEIINVFYQNTFVSIDVLHELEKNNIKNIIINNEDENYYLSLYYYDINNNDINNYIIKIIRIIKIIKKINDYFEPNNNQKYNVIIFLSNCKKTFMGDKITPISINSGSTLYNVYASVWRKEELEKVLIHELLHYIRCDFFYNDNGYETINNNILNIFNIEGVNNPNESYNETVAGIINMCYKSITLKKDLNNIYNKELNFLYLQSAKLINYFSGKNISDLFNKKITIKQTTSALSYLFLKMILFHNILYVCDFIKKINLKCNEKNKILEFNEILIELINKKDYYNYVNEYINEIKNYNKDDYILKTMRMSLL